MKTSFLAKYIAAILSVFTLFGCAKKPPECADQAASDTLHRVMNEQVVEGLRYLGVNAKDDKRGVIAQYLNTWTFGLSNISTVGYVEASRTRICKAKATMAVPGYDKGGEIEVDYTLQTFEDSKSGEFELKAAHNFVVWANNAAAIVKPYYSVNRLLGTWAGTTNCNHTTIAFSNTEGSQPMVADGEQGYSLLSSASAWAPDAQDNTYPVSLELKGGNATMHITKPDGSKVTRTGKLDSGGEVKLDNKDELATLVLARGYFSGEKFNAPAANSITVQARVKSNATGKELSAQLERRCGFDVAKQP
jgi:hypothetical protein